MAVVLQPWQILVASLAGWIARQQDAVIEYLREENRAAYFETRVVAGDRTKLDPIGVIFFDACGNRNFSETTPLVGSMPL